MSKFDYVVVTRDVCMSSEMCASHSEMCASHSEMCASHSEMCASHSEIWEFQSRDLVRSRRLM